MLTVLIQHYARPSIDVAYLAIVAINPSHSNTTLATALPLCRYSNGGLIVSSAILRASADEAEIHDECVATITVNAKASAKAIKLTTKELILQDHRIRGGSKRSGKKRSKKNAAPKIVATEIPTKML